MQVAASTSPRTPAELRELLRPLAPELRQRGVGRLWLFGSRAQQSEHAGSDWDLLVEFSRPLGLEDYMNLKFWLEERIGGRVDLVSRTACKPRFLAAISAELLDVA